MKEISFFRGVVVALILAFCASILFAVLTPLFNGVLALQIIISLLTLAYVIYLLAAGAARTGRLVAFTGSALIIGAMMYVQPSLALYALTHIGLIWLIRSCYFYTRLLVALADIGFCGLGFAAAVWAAESSGSVFLSFWCFFLVQALVVPVLRQTATAVHHVDPDMNDPFGRAHRSAEAALRRLSQRSN